MQTVSPAHVLVINPNTSDAVTRTLTQHLAQGLPQAQVQGVTAAFGAPYIADERSYCIAGHAVLDAWERAQATAPASGFAAVLVGCFGDPGLEALREVCAVPVLGLAEASMRTMAAQGKQRVAVVTGGEKWKPMLERWCRATGHDAAGGMQSACITQVRALPANGAQMMQSPETALAQLGEACLQSLRESGAQAVLLGGAGLAGMGERLRAQLDIPVWDCVEAARWCLARTLAYQAAGPTAVPGAK